MNATISIGVLAQQTGCTVPTIRYYEEIGLLPAGPRTEAGRRLYREPAGMLRCRRKRLRTHPRLNPRRATPDQRDITGGSGLPGSDFFALAQVIEHLIAGRSLRDSDVCAPSND